MGTDLKQDILAENNPVDHMEILQTLEQPSEGLFEHMNRYGDDISKCPFAAEIGKIAADLESIRKDAEKFKGMTLDDLLSDVSDIPKPVLEVTKPQVKQESVTTEDFVLEELRHLQQLNDNDISRIETVVDTPNDHQLILPESVIEKQIPNPDFITKSASQEKILPKTESISLVEETKQHVVEVKHEESIHTVEYKPQTAAAEEQEPSLVDIDTMSDIQVLDMVQLNVDQDVEPKADISIILEPKFVQEEMVEDTDNRNTTESGISHEVYENSISDEISAVIDEIVERTVTGEMVSLEDIEFEQFVEVVTNELKLIAVEIRDLGPLEKVVAIEEIQQRLVNRIETIVLEANLPKYVIRNMIEQLLEFLNVPDSTKLSWLNQQGTTEFKFYSGWKSQRAATYGTVLHAAIGKYILGGVTAVRLAV